jgi:hypothetical protein
MPQTIVWRNGVCAVPELQKMPQAQILAECASRPSAAVSVARPSSRNVHSAARNYHVRRLQKINEAYERMLRSHVKYRFSIDMGSLSHAA